MMHPLTPPHLLSPPPGCTGAQPHGRPERSEQAKQTKQTKQQDRFSAGGAAHGVYGERMGGGAAHGAEALWRMGCMGSHGVWHNLMWHAPEPCAMPLSLVACP